MGISRRTAELAVAFGIFIVGLAIIGDSVHLGIGWSNNSPQPGYFPGRGGGIRGRDTAGGGARAGAAPPRRCRRPRATAGRSPPRAFR